MGSLKLKFNEPDSEADVRLVFCLHDGSNWRDFL